MRISKIQSRVNAWAGWLRAYYTVKLIFVSYLCHCERFLRSNPPRIMADCFVAPPVNRMAGQANTAPRNDTITNLVYTVLHSSLI